MTHKKHNKSLDEIRDIIIHTSRRGISRLIVCLHNHRRSKERQRLLIMLHLLNGTDERTGEHLGVMFLLRFMFPDRFMHFAPANYIKFIQQKAVLKTFGPPPGHDIPLVEKLLTRSLFAAKAPKQISETRRRRCEYRNQCYLEHFDQILDNTLKEPVAEFQRVFLITPGLNPHHKIQTLRKIIYCVKMIRKFGSQWVWQVEAYLDDPLYDKLLHYHADPLNWHNDVMTFGSSPRGGFTVSATAEKLKKWFHQGRERDVYDFTEWGLKNLQFNPHVYEMIGYPALLEEMNYATTGPLIVEVTPADLLVPPEEIPRRFTAFTRLTMARTVCAVLHGAITVDQIKEPQLSAVIRSAIECKNRSLSEEQLLERLEKYVNGETERTKKCREAAIEFVIALWSDENFDELYLKHGGTRMARPTSHRAHADTPADIADRMMYYYHLCHKHGLLALETFRKNDKLRYSHEPTWKKEPDPVIGLLLQLLTEGFGYEIDRISQHFSHTFQRQVEDRAAIAAWSLYAWGTGTMTVVEIARVLAGCLEEGRALPKA